MVILVVRFSAVDRKIGIRLTNMAAPWQIYLALLLEVLNGTLSHGGLYRWRGNSFPFFVYHKLKEILIRYSRIILTASKDRLISKI